PSSGILTGFPFDKVERKIVHFKTELPYLLGSTYPCPTAICTRGCFTRIHILSFVTNLHALLLVRASLLP
ncbi:hypothetical protein BCR36DRAFT_293870, partial [Piromyces finnis]